MRHFSVMHHMMEKAAATWPKQTGIDRNPAVEVELKRPNDQRERYLSAEEITSFKVSLDAKMYRQGSIRRHAFASWFMMNGGDLNELAKYR